MRKTKTPTLEVAAFRSRRWVTRPRPGVDRMASAWLIRRFIDPAARFEFAAEPPSRGERVPFDMYGVEFGHQGGRCSFEVLADRFGLGDRPAIRRLGRLVRAIDLHEPAEEAAEAETVARLVAGLRATHADDRELLEAGIGVFEALHAAAPAARSYIRSGSGTPRRSAERAQAAREDLKDGQPGARAAPGRAPAGPGGGGRAALKRCASSSAWRATSESSSVAPAFSTTSPICADREHQVPEVVARQAPARQRARPRRRDRRPASPAARELALDVLRAHQRVLQVGARVALEGERLVEVEGDDAGGGRLDHEEAQRGGGDLRAPAASSSSPPSSRLRSAISSRAFASSWSSRSSALTPIPLRPDISSALPSSPSSRSRAAARWPARAPPSRRRSAPSAPPPRCGRAPRARRARSSAGSSGGRR